MGGEGFFFSQLGFKSITVTDLSAQALSTCNSIFPNFKTLQLNAEHMELEDNSFDIVVVRDGLHHISRPVLGYTEMLRISRNAVIVIEPHTGMVARVFGTKWERHQGEVNYVFRWNQNLLEQTTKSYILQKPYYVKALRIWDHNLVISRVVKPLFPYPLNLWMAKCLYFLLNTVLFRMGNMMVGVVVKKQ